MDQPWETRAPELPKGEGSPSAFSLSTTTAERAEPTCTITTNAITTCRHIKAIAIAIAIADEALVSLDIPVLVNARAEQLLAPSHVGGLGLLEVGLAGAVHGEGERERHG